MKQLIKNETKEQKGGFLGILLGTTGASLLGNTLASAGVISTKGACLLGNMLTGTDVIRVGKKQLKLLKIIDAISSFN